jgi:lysosomal acid lipase/cholesteryl ester hydrolase
MTDRVYTVHTRKRGPLATSLHPLTTPDGMRISVSRLAAPAPADAVLLIHGLTTSSDMFVMPEHQGLCAHLADEGFDVWLADFRMSNHYAYNTEASRNGSFEDIAANDWPTIVGFIREQVGARRRLHVIAHCLGSATFHYALYGKTVGGIASVVSNSVSLHPRVHPLSALKLVAAPFLVEKVLRLPYLDPAWADKDNARQPWLGRLIARLVGLYHLECNVDACNLVSFTWGAGCPAIFQHANMATATHDRLPELFGPIAMPYFRTVRRAVWGGGDFGLQSKSPEHKDVFPRRLIDRVGEVKLPTLLLSGDRNDIFPGSNRVTAALVKQKGVDGYEYRELPGYGHQDVFMGKDCEHETFPIMVDFIRRAGGRSGP